MLKWERIEVSWVDSCTTTDQWTTIEELTDDDMLPAACQSVGYLLRFTTTELALVQSRDPDNQTIKNALVIPRSCIQSITYLDSTHTDLINSI